MGRGRNVGQADADGYKTTLGRGAPGGRAGGQNRDGNKGAAATGVRDGRGAELRPGEWACGKCAAANRAHRSECYKCGNRAPVSILNRQRELRKNGNGEGNNGGNGGKPDRDVQYLIDALAKQKVVEAELRKEKADLALKLKKGAEAAPGGSGGGDQGEQLEEPGPSEAKGKLREVERHIKNLEGMGDDAEVLTLLQKRREEAAGLREEIKAAHPLDVQLRILEAKLAGAQKQEAKFHEEAKAKCQIFWQVKVDMDKAAAAAAEKKAEGDRLLREKHELVSRICAAKEAEARKAVPSAAGAAGGKTVEEAIAEVVRLLGILPADIAGELRPELERRAAAVQAAQAAAAKAAAEAAQTAAAAPTTGVPPAAGAETAAGAAADPGGTGAASGSDGSKEDSAIAAAKALGMQAALDKAAKVSTPPDPDGDLAMGSGSEDNSGEKGLKNRRVGGQA